MTQRANMQKGITQIGNNAKTHHTKRHNAKKATPKREECKMSKGSTEKGKKKKKYISLKGRRLPSGLNSRCLLGTPHREFDQNGR